MTDAAKQRREKKFAGQLFVITVIAMACLVGVPVPANVCDQASSPRSVDGDFIIRRTVDPLAFRKYARGL